MTDAKHIRTGAKSQPKPTWLPTRHHLTRDPPEHPHRSVLPKAPSLTPRGIKPRWEAAGIPAASPPCPRAAIHKNPNLNKRRARRRSHTPLTGERPSYSLLSPSHATSKHSSAEAMRCLAASQLEAKRGFSFPAAQPHSGTSCLYTTLFIAAGEQPGATQPQSSSGSSNDNNKINKIKAIITTTE